MKQKQGADSGLKEDGIPTRQAGSIALHAIGDLGGCRPMAIDLSRKPDADIRRSFPGPTEPDGYQSAFYLSQRRSMTRGERRALEDELRRDHSGVRGRGRATG